MRNSLIYNSSSLLISESKLIDLNSLITTFVKLISFAIFGANLISCRNSECNFTLLSIEFGTDRIKSFFALVNATKNSLLSSSFSSVIHSVRLEPITQNGNLIFSITLLEPQFHRYRDGMNTVSNSSHFDW